MLDSYHKKYYYPNIPKSQLYKKLLDDQIQMKNRRLRMNENPQQYQSSPHFRLATQPINKQLHFNQYGKSAVRVRQYYLPAININKGYQSNHLRHSQLPSRFNLSKDKLYSIPYVSQDNNVQQTEQCLQQCLQQCDQIINNLKIIPSKDTTKKLSRQGSQYKSTAGRKSKINNETQFNYSQKKQKTKKYAWKSMNKIDHFSENYSQNTCLQLDSRIQVKPRRSNIDNQSDKMKATKHKISMLQKNGDTYVLPLTHLKIQGNKQACQTDRSNRSKDLHNNVMKYLIEAKNRGKKLSEKILKYRASQAKHQQQKTKIQQ